MSDTDRDAALRAIDEAVARALGEDVGPGEHDWSDWYDSEGARLTGINRHCRRCWEPHYRGGAVGGGTCAARPRPRSSDLSSAWRLADSAMSEGYTVDLQGKGAGRMHAGTWEATFAGPGLLTAGHGVGETAAEAICRAWLMMKGEGVGDG